MALGEFKLFQFKSKKQREKEEREYAAWAFPYGDLQKEKLSELIKELMPKASLPICLASYLTCKELFDTALEENNSREEAINRMVNYVGSYGQLIKKNEMTTYLALVLIDAIIDEKCEYPSIDDIRAKIQELNDLREVKKSKLFKSKE